jgi:hypothetical protein
VNEQPLAILEELRKEFRRVDASRAPRVTLTRRTLLVALLLLLLVLVGVAAAAIVIGEGGALPAPNPRDLAANGVPLPGSARLAGLDAPDPDPAEPPWDIRLSRTAAGETCTAVGQVVTRGFGIVGLDHVFRALPLGGVDACGVDTPHGPLLAGVRVFLGRGSGEARTVVNGVAGPHARSVTVYGPGGARAVRLGPDGSFITVYAGYVEEVRPRVVVVSADGRQHTLAFAHSSALEVVDPEGRSPWQVSGGADVEPGAYADENCAQASEDLGRSDPSRFEAPLTPEVCGRLGSQPLFVLMRRFVPGSGEHTGFPWGNSPARTLVYGAAEPRVSSLTLTGAGAPRTLAINRRGGVFLAVLDGHVDPRSLTLLAHLRDGHTFIYRHSTTLFAARPNRTLAAPPVPTYRGPVPRSEEVPAMEIPIRSSMREQLTVKDPVGGPEWVLRSWRGRPNPRASFGGGPPGEMVCEQVGVREHGQLVQPPPAAPVALTPGKETGGYGGCNALAWLAHHPPVGEATSYVDNPYGYAPHPLRTVVSGMLGRGASRPVLLDAGAPRALKLDANGMFLAVLPGRYWDARLRLIATVRGKHVKGYPLASFNGAEALDVPQARAPDPNGGAPWGYGVSGEQSAVGQILHGRLVAIDPETGEIHPGPDSWGGGSLPPSPARTPRPVRFEANGGPEAGLGSRDAGEPSAPEVQRRTLPGRTIITGRAAADVTSVTIVTPRDVRTLRPRGPHHALIAVYDGQFFTGKITATVLLRGGRTVTEQIPDPSNREREPPREPTLAAQLARTRREIAEWTGPRTGTGKIAEGYELLAGSLATIERRIAFVHRHPGLLPGS